MTLDPHAILRNRIIENVLDSDADSPASQRRAAFEGKGVPPDVQALIDKIEAHAYKVTDDDLRRLQERYSDDELFELIVAAALGASERRLAAGLEALDNA